MISLILILDSCTTPRSSWDTVWRSVSWNFLYVFQFDVITQLAVPIVNISSISSQLRSSCCEAELFVDKVVELVGSEKRDGRFQVANTCCAETTSSQRKNSSFWCEDVMFFLTFCWSLLWPMMCSVRRVFVFSRFSAAIRARRDSDKKTRSLWWKYRSSSELCHPWNTHSNDVLHVA